MDPSSTSALISEYLAKIEAFSHIPTDLVAAIAVRLGIIRLASGEVLCEEGAPGYGLYLLVEGRLRVSIRMGAEDRAVGMVEPGEVVGELQALTGGQRSATIRADGPAVAIEMSAEVLREILGSNPRLAEEFAALSRRRMRRNQLATLLPNLLGPIDDEQLSHISQRGSWVHLERGERLMAQGEPSDAVYLVVSGRLQAVVEMDGREYVVGEIARGEPVGEIGIFTGEPRMASVHALRDSELLAFTKPVFDEIIQHHPDVLMAMTRIAVERTRSTVRAATVARHLRCITLIPANAGVPIQELATRLAAELGDRVLLLTAERLDDLYGTRGAAQLERNDPDYIRLSAWLDEQEDTYDHVLYVAEAHPSAWTRQAIQRADQLLICAWAHDDPAPGPDESQLGPDTLLPSVRRSLVLLHENGSEAPRGTKRWLDGRELHRHYHVRWNRREDLARLGRFLTDRAIGLTLGGGGARGLAHIGVVRAFRELGIPIDFVGGTSMGACIAALAALEYDFEKMREVTTATFITPRPFKQYTLPLYSVLRNGVFDVSATQSYGTGDVEDCWINCFMVASNLSTAEMLVLERGPLAESVLSSMALPGTVAPRIREGHLIADGAVLNNLPVDIMRERAHRIVAVDVGGGKKALRVRFESFPSPWQVAWRRISPFHANVRVPNLMEIMLRSALLASTQRERDVKDQCDVYLTPPMNGFALLQMDRLEEIVEVGYRYALDALAEARPRLA